MWHNKGNNETAKKMVDNIMQEMIKEEPNWKKLLGTEGYVEKLVGLREFRDLNTTQLRKFFEVVKKIDSSLRVEGWTSSTSAELWKLVPAIKYASGRGNVPQAFEYFVSQSVEKIDSSQNKETVFRNFERIFESIVAYHKYKYHK